MSGSAVGNKAPLMGGTVVQCLERSMGVGLPQNGRHKGGGTDESPAHNGISELIVS